MYYLAYGSNLNVQQMRKRCPTAKVVGQTILKGWRLRFRGKPDSGVATIEPQKGYSVPVGIWQISEMDEIALDFYEGYPFLYFKATIIIDLNGQQIGAMTYLMDETYPYNVPSFDYLCTIRDGYTAFGMEKQTLREAVNTIREMVNNDRKD